MMIMLQQLYLKGYDKTLIGYLKMVPLILSL